MNILQPFETLEQNTCRLMESLEKQDIDEREKNLETKVRLRQIPRETGEFLFQSIYQIGKLSNKTLKGIEIGTSGAYSTIWQALAFQKIGKEGSKLLTLEIDPKKIALAKKNIHICNLESQIEIVEGDAKQFLKKQKESDNKYDYFFLDAEKEDYAYYYPLIKEIASDNAIMYADNVISHKEYLKGFLDLIEKDKDVLSTVIPIGKGVAKVIFPQTQRW